MSTISLIASSLRSDLYGRYIIDRESPYTANEKDRLPTRVVCWASAVRGHRVGSSAKLESRTRRLIMFVLIIRCRPRIAGYQIGHQFADGDRHPSRVTTDKAQTEQMFSALPL